MRSVPVIVASLWRQEDVMGMLARDVVRSMRPLLGRDRGPKGLAAYTPRGHEALVGFEDDEEFPGLDATDIARHLADAIEYGHLHSEDEKRQVGASLIGPNNMVLARGANTRKRVPVGDEVDNNFRFDHGETNTLDAFFAQNPGAEIPYGSEMVVSHVPCQPCKGRILEFPAIRKLHFPLPFVRNMVVRGDKLVELQEVEQGFNEMGVVTQWVPINELVLRHVSDQNRPEILRRFEVWANRQVPAGVHIPLG